MCPLSVLCMGKRRVSDETNRVLKGAIEEIERVEEEKPSVYTNLDRFKKVGVGVCADRIILDAVKCFMREDDRFDFAEFRDNLVDADK